MTPEERTRADGLAASAFQLATDLMDAVMRGESARADKIRLDLNRVCRELTPLLVMYRDEQDAWRNRGRHHGS